MSQEYIPIPELVDAAVATSDEVLTAFPPSVKSLQPQRWFQLQS
jgi:hypothetical protein